MITLLVIPRYWVVSSSEETNTQKFDKMKQRKKISKNGKGFWKKKKKMVEMKKWFNINQLNGFPQTLWFKYKYNFINIKTHLFGDLLSNRINGILTNIIFNFVNKVINPLKNKNHIIKFNTLDQ